MRPTLLTRETRKPQNQSRRTRADRPVQGCEADRRKISALAQDTKLILLFSRDRAPCAALALPALQGWTGLASPTLDGGAR